MAVKKSMLEEAIAEAKTIRETAIKNAYITLEESLTPSIKEMLANSLEEEEETEEQIEEDVNSGYEKVSSKKTVKEADSKNVPEDEESEDDNQDLNLDDDDEESPEENEEEEIPSDEEASEEVEDENPSDETPLADITIGDLKDILSSVVGPQEPAPEGDLGVDAEIGDVEGQGEEDAPLDGEEGEGMPAGDFSEPEEETSEDDEEIDLSELLKELENEVKVQPKKPVCKNGNCSTKSLNEEIKKLKSKLNEAYKTISTLKETLSETNLLNSKLMYTTKLFNEHRLSDTQKANVIKSLDKATDIKDAKTIYRTLSENFVPKPSKPLIKEHKSLSSKSAGKSTATIVETNDWVRRMQELAGIN